MLKYGFSLIELMVVVVIAGILMTIAVPTYKNYKARADVNTMMRQIANVTQAFKLYYIENGTWATSPSDIGYTTAGTGGFDVHSEVSPFVTYMTQQIDTLSCGKKVVHLYINSSIKVNGGGFGGLRVYIGEDSEGNMLTACTNHSNHEYTTSCNYSDLASFTTAICN